MVAPHITEIPSRSEEPNPRLEMESAAAISWEPNTPLYESQSAQKGSGSAPRLDLVLRESSGVHHPLKTQNPTNSSRKY